jgi:hypothetical protein
MSHNTIDVSGYTKQINDYSKEIKEFYLNNNLKLPKINSLKGQAIALLTSKDNLNKYITREILDEFLTKIGLYSKDCIQLLNKTEQNGLKSICEERTYYQIPYPFIYIDTHIKKRNIPKGVFDEQKKKDSYDVVMDYITKYYINEPYEKWQVGHKNPDITDSTNNLIMQPTIQGKYRDNYIFMDNGLGMIPVPSHFMKKIDELYTPNQKKELFELVMAEINKTNNKTNDE